MKSPTADNSSHEAETFSEFEGWLENDAWLRRAAAAIARRIRPSLDAGDIAQETWLSALRHSRAERRSGERVNSPRRWLAKIAGNVALQKRRAAVRREEHEDAAAATALERNTPENTAHTIEVTERRLAVHAAVEALPDSMREVIVLHHLEGHDVAAVARRLGIPKETVRSRLKRSRALLRQRLGAADERGSASALIVSANAAAERGANWITRAAGPIIAMKIGSKAAVLPIVLVLALLGTSLWVWSTPPDDKHRQAEPADPLAQATPIAESTPAGLTEIAALTPTPTKRTVIASSTTVATPDVTAVLPSATVRGFVLGVDGRPVPFARVGASGSDLEATTDLEGSFEWPVLQGIQRLAASAPGKITVFEANVLPASSGNDARELTIVVAPSMRLTGHVERGDSTPAAGAKLYLRLDDPWSRNIERELAGGAVPSFHATSDTQGRFSFTDVPAIEGTLIWIEHTEGRALYRCPSETTLDLRFSLREQEAPSYPMMPCRFVDAAGQAISNGIVEVHEWESALSSEGTLDVPRSIVEDFASFDVFVPGYLPSRVEAALASSTGPEAVVRTSTWTSAPAERAPTRWPEELTVVLAQHDAPVIRGRVVSPAGVPLDDHPVWLLDPSKFREFADDRLGPINLSTDEDGRFEFRVLHDRSYAVSATSPTTFRRCVVEDLRAGDHAVEITLGDLEERGQFDGRCVALDGTPLAGVKVTPAYAQNLFGWASGGLSVSATSDDNGYFSLEDIHLDVSHLEFDGRAVIPETVDVPFHRAEGPLEVTLARRATVRFDATAVGGDYDFAALAPIDRQAGPKSRDNDLALLITFQWIELSSGPLEGSDQTSWAEFAEGRSAPYTVAEGVYEARLFANERIVRRERVRVDPGETTVVTFMP